MRGPLARAMAVEGGFYDQAAAWISGLVTQAAVILDLGSGCGAAACALAHAFPEAYVVVANASRASLAEARRRSVEEGVAERIETWQCAPGAGVLDGEQADVVWARDVLPDPAHPAWSLPDAARCVRPGGLLAWAGGERETRVLPDELDLGRPGLLRRAEAAADGAGPDAHGDGDGDGGGDGLGFELLERVGLLPAASRTFLVDIPPPLGDAARAHVAERLRLLSTAAADRLDPDDALALACLLNPDDPRCVTWRRDVFYRTRPEVQVAYRVY
jgi:SAM-dependent methyltransferase